MERDKAFTTNPYQLPTLEEKLEELRAVAKEQNIAIEQETPGIAEITVFFPNNELKLRGKVSKINFLQ